MSTVAHPRQKGQTHTTQRGLDFAKELKHTNHGVWDVYQQIPQSKFGVGVAWASTLTPTLEIIQDVPFAWKMVKDVIKIKSCWYYICPLVVVKLLASFQPAVALWCVTSWFPPIFWTSLIPALRFTGYHVAIVRMFQNHFTTSNQRASGPNGHR